jgi:hypothetical protein
MMIRYVMCIQCVDDQTFIQPLDTLRFRSTPTPPKRPKGVEFRLKSDYTDIWFPAEFMWCFKISSDEQMGNVPYELQELEGENDQ